jgi:hypothetical protein
MYRNAVDRYVPVTNGQHEAYAQIRKYLLRDDSSLANVKLPIIWIHVPFEYNARHWESFYSRSSMELNMPYLYLTLQSVIRHCDKDFHICVIDDTSFFKLLPNWEIDLSNMAGEMRENVRRLAITRLIYEYGGMSVPISFLCFRSLMGLWTSGTGSGRMFVCEKMDRNITSTVRDLFPSVEFMGAERGAPIIKELLAFMGRITSEDYTAQSVFVGDFDRWVAARSPGQVSIIGGSQVGTADSEGRPLPLDVLMEERPLDLYNDAYGLWIPFREMLNREAYGWWLRQSPEQVLSGNTALAHTMLVATGQSIDASLKPPKKPNWIDYWRVPLGASLWGFKPTGIGSEVPRGILPNPTPARQYGPPSTA